MLGARLGEAGTRRAQRREAGRAENPHQDSTPPLLTQWLASTSSAPVGHSPKFRVAGEHTKVKVIVVSPPSSILNRRVRREPIWSLHQDSAWWGSAISPVNVGWGWEGKMEGAAWKWIDGHWNPFHVLGIGLFWLLGPVSLPGTFWYK